ncbi:hypothetical protein AM571_CH02664 [Rhizobium etli 8C-3]|uniref:Uncharacterized protein n=1 Tax=Rhizobium etli 8C-3 TaxID=538025 RepID=A0A1L5P5S3_RHIET|nr:hypothetical protein AM571_CH02664 [Rhizobium etli 8C-3]
MTFKAQLTTIADAGRQSFSASKFPAMVMCDPPRPSSPLFKSNGDSHNFRSRQAFPQKKPSKTRKKPYPQARNRSSDCFA